MISMFYFNGYNDVHDFILIEKTTDFYKWPSCDSWSDAKNDGNGATTYEKLIETYKTNNVLKILDYE